MGGGQGAKLVLPFVVIMVAAMLLLAFLYRPVQARPDDLYQVSPFNVFSSGGYDGNTTFAELSRQGDLGIGTFNGLDGEMVALDGRFYQVRTDGTPREADPSDLTPYATVTFFDEDLSFHVDGVSNLTQLCSLIGARLPSDASIYAIKVTGSFQHVQARSVPKQVQPYPPLSDAVRNQTVFELSEVEGTAVGFYFPESMDGVDYVGYHLHFLTTDLVAGGHMLNCSVDDAVVQLDEILQYRLALR